jgi:hypothetical protein
MIRESALLKPVVVALTGGRYDTDREPAMQDSITVACLAPGNMRVGRCSSVRTAVAGSPARIQ